MLFFQTSKFKRIVFTFVYLGFGSFLFPVTSANAQSAADISNAARQSEIIQQQQLQRQGADIRNSLQNRRPPARITVQEPATPKGRGAGCRNIKMVEIKGATHMDDFDKRALTRNYNGRCLGVNEIQSLMGEITKYYIDKGYATTRVYLPSQDLTSGKLIVQIVEGRVQDIKIKNGSKGAFLPGAFPGVKGGDLNLRDIEQGLDQINRLLSNNASMDIEPGTKAGDSIINISNNPTKRWHAGISGDNYGTRTTGREQLGINASYDNLFGLNEFYSFTKRNTVPYRDRSQQAGSNSYLFSIPYGYTTFLVGYTESNYNSTLNTAGGTQLQLEGDNRAYFTSVDQVVYRNQDSKLNLTGTLTQKSANNYISNQKLAVSSRRLTVLDIGLNYNTLMGGGAANFGAGYSRGLTWFNALEDLPALPGSIPHAQFSKLTASAGYSRPFDIMRRDFNYSTQVTGQFGLDTLYGSEQISAGGIYSVRGFYDTTLLNDHGLSVRNDLTLLQTLATIRGLPVSFRPYVALDGGTVWGRAPKSPSGTLIGAAIGFSMAYGPASFDVYTGKPISAPDDIEKEGFNTFGRFAVTF